MLRRIKNGLFFIGLIVTAVICIIIAVGINFQIVELFTKDVDLQAIVVLLLLIIEIGFFIGVVEG